MRWTQENEDILWQTVFKTHSFHIDLSKISDAWLGNENPSPRALKEHLSKYRKNLGSNSRITFGMSSKNGGTGASATPKKRGLNQKGRHSAPARPTKSDVVGKAHALVKVKTKTTTGDDGDSEESDDVKVHTSKRIKIKREEDAIF